MAEKIADVVNGAPMGNPDVLRALEETLREARAGRVAAVAIVVARGPGQTAATAAGGFLPELYMGADMLKAKMLEAAGGGGPRSSILMPRR